MFSQTGQARCSLQVLLIVVSVFMHGGVTASESTQPLRLNDRTDAEIVAAVGRFSGRSLLAP